MILIHPKECLSKKIRNSLGEEMKLRRLLMCKEETSQTTLKYTVGKNNYVSEHTGPFYQKKKFQAGFTHAMPNSKYYIIILVLDVFISFIKPILFYFSQTFTT